MVTVPLGVGRMDTERNCAELDVARRTVTWTQIRNCEPSTANRIQVILVDGG